MRILVCSRTLLAALLGVTCGVAQVAPSDPDVAGDGCYADRVMVRLIEGLRATAVDGAVRVRAKDGDAAPAFAARLTTLGELEVGVPLPMATLDAWHAKAVAATPPGREAPGHLGRWLRIRTADRAARDAALDVLATIGVVELAYAEPVPVVQSPPPPAGSNGTNGGNGDLPPTTPSFESMETWSGPAPTGFGVVPGRQLLGARGRDIQVFHTESSWVIDHEDLPSVDASSYVGTPPVGYDPQTDHAMGALGLLVAGRNGFGMTGAVDRARPRLCGWFANNTIAESIALCTAEAAPGDVIVMLGGYDLFQVGPRDFVPAEFYQFDFDAIATAVAQGVIVVTAATNGNNDLDDPRFARRFDRSVRDSGAVMVGATDGSTAARASYSNHGSRCDVSGWGGDLVTLGYGNLFFPGGDRRQSYVDRYAGTSSAASLVAGVAAMLSNIAMRQLGRVLTPGEIRRLLRDHASPADRSVGPRPDLAAVLRSLGLPDGLELASGEVPVGGRIDVRASGPADATSFVFASLSVGSFDGGWNRDLHLGANGLAFLAALPLSGGTANLRVPLPNDPALADLEIVLQAFRVDPGASVPHVSSSAVVWLR